MTMPKTKTLLKYAVIAYLVYLLYSIPKKDWSKGTVITEKLESGATARYAPQQSAYIKYAAAWWRITSKQKGITGIIDEYILAPLGINFDDDNKSETNAGSGTSSSGSTTRSSGTTSGYVRR